MSSSQTASCKGRKKALLIAVKHMKGSNVPLTQTHNDARTLNDLLISQYGYAQDDIVILLDDPGLNRALWTCKNNILKQIEWLVGDLGEHDRLVFYYSGHGGQTVCRHGTEIDGKDEFICTHGGCKILDNDLKKFLVDPVLKVKGCQLLALFDCCHSETILDLRHDDCCFRLPHSIDSSTAYTYTSSMDLEGTLSLADGPARTASVNQQVSIKTAFVSPPISPTSLHRTVASVGVSILIDSVRVSSPDLIASPLRIEMSPTRFRPDGNFTCPITKEEENQGHVVCLSACRDGEMASDDKETGETFTKFFMSTLIANNCRISYRDLLHHIQSQVSELQEKRIEYIQERPSEEPFEASLHRCRESVVTSENDIDSNRRRRFPQEPRISSNRPFDLNEEISI